MISDLKRQDLSILIPCFNEEACIEDTVQALVSSMDQASISYEILCVNNASTDNTEGVLEKLTVQFPTVRYVNTPRIAGYGVAVRWGLEHYEGNMVVIVMADGSESPQDILSFYSKIKDGYDCAFGSRFMAESTVEGYPRFKLVLNRMGNKCIAFAMQFAYNDFTNGFKCYRREVIDAIKPLFGEKFNLTIEMSINTVALRPRIAIVPNSWRDRSAGISKFNVVKQAWLYLLTLLYCWLRWRIQGSSWLSFRKALLEEKTPDSPNYGVVE